MHGNKVFLVTQNNKIKTGFKVVENRLTNSVYEKYYEIVQT